MEVMPIRPGDKITKTRQVDGSYSIVIDLKHADGDRRIVANVPGLDAFYAHVRDMVDNPPERDLEFEREILQGEIVSWGKTPANHRSRR